MTVRVGDPELVLDPYDYDFHEDPYPYYRRLRDEAPLYRNEERNFWAVSRHHDVLQGFRDSTALSNVDAGHGRPRTSADAYLGVQGLHPTADP